MSSNEIRNLKPVISVALIILTLFSVVFLQMEERRLGYSLLKLTRHYRQIVENRKNKEIQLAKATRPQWVEKIAASKFTLKKAEANQIILLSNPFEDAEQ
jgi:cell division protein FtsL